MKTFITVSSEFVDDNNLKKIIAANSQALQKLNLQLHSDNEFYPPENIGYFVVSGGTEQQILDIHKKRSAKFPGEDVVLLAHATHNSLPAALEVMARLHMDNTRGRIIYLPQIETNHFSANIREFIDKETLAARRIGLVGAPSDWLVASLPSPETVKAALGAEVIPLEIDEIKQSFQKVNYREIKEIKADFINNALEIIEPSEQEIEDNIRVYLAIKQLVSKYKLDAVTVRCFDLVSDLKTTGCFALSRLNDEGIIAGCEGDLVSTLGMMWAFAKVGKLPWMANPAQVDLRDNSLILAHCTVPRSLISNYLVRSHFESGIGVGIQGNFPTREVEIFRLGGKSLSKIWWAKGKLIQNGNDDNLCRTQIKVKLNTGFFVQDLLIEPLGNHLIVVDSSCGSSLLQTKDSHIEEYENKKFDSIK